MFTDIKDRQNTLTPGTTIQDTVTVDQLKTFLTTMDTKYGNDWLSDALIEMSMIYLPSKIIIQDPVQFAQSVYGLYNK